MLIETSKPQAGCILSKDSCSEFCFVDTELVVSQATNAQIVIIINTNAVEGSGVFLGQDITNVVLDGNTLNNYDQTVVGFQTMFNLLFPQYNNSTFTVFPPIGSFVPVIIDIEPAGELDNFDFVNGAGITVFTLNTFNGQDAVIDDCNFKVIIYDGEDNNELCVLPLQEPNVIEGDNGLEMEPICIRPWNDVGTNTDFPFGDEDGTPFIDPDFCKKVIITVWKQCNNDDCGYKATEAIVSDPFTVINSVYDGDFLRYCILEQVSDGNLADWMTEIKCIDLCEGVDAWLWICPNLSILDTIGLPYEFIASYSFFDENGNPIFVGSPTTSSVATENGSFVIPSGYNYLDNPPHTIPPSFAYYEVSFNVIINGVTIQLTNPIRYNIVSCCCDGFLYFQERLGGVNHLCLENIIQKVTDAQGVTYCVGDGCDKKTITADNEAEEIWDIETFTCNVELLEVFRLTTKFWLKIDGEFRSVSIEKRVISTDNKDGITKVSLKINLGKFNLND